LIYRTNFLNFIFQFKPIAMQVIEGVKVLLTDIGTANATNAIKKATDLKDYQQELLVEFGATVKHTTLFKRLELAATWYEIKSEIFKVLFRIYINKKPIK